VLHDDEAGNLIWRWGEAEPALVVAAHLDTVFAADTRLDARRDGETLVGPGVGDNAAAVAVAVNVVSPLLGRGCLGPGAVAFTVGEEGLGNLRGAIAVCARWPTARFVAVEGHGLERVIVDAVGSIRARVTVRGPGGHSWADRGSPSATHALLALGADLTELGGPETPVNIGQVSGGRSVNAIADRAQLLVEMRALDEEPLEEFGRRLGAIALPPPLRAEVEIVGRRPAGRLGRDDPLLAAVQSIRVDLALPPDLDAGSTDASAALARGMSALCLGVTTGAGMHTTAERVEVPPLRLGCRQLEALLLDQIGTT
jgi:acetylornithine deacetylase/succinyl-diaminopimelate desuccinylase-like protein